MTEAANSRLAAAEINRTSQTLFKLVLAAMMALAGSGFVGWGLAAAWLGAYAVIISAESWVFSPAQVHDRLATPWGPAAAFAFSLVANLVFSALGVFMVVAGGPWGAVCGAFVIMGATCSVLLTCASSPMLFVAGLAPDIVCFTALPIMATRQGYGAITVLELIFGALFYLGATVLAWRRFANLLEAANQARADAEAANRCKSAFLAMMSHEIRTPMNGVLGMAQAMDKDPLDDVQRARLAVIRQSGESLLSILNDLLDLSKIEAGKLEIEAVEFEFADVVAEVEATFSARACEKALVLETCVAPSAQGAFRGDPTRLRQVLSNLTSNALKFTDRGAVRIMAAWDDGWLEVRVSDTGIGIAPDALGRIFSQFVQADASTTRRFGGTGLGLPICRELASLMGGSIAVESEVGQGTTFTVRLPMTRLGGAAPKAQTGGEVWTAGPASRLRILVAEDNPTNQVVIRTLLQQAGLEPELASDGEEALAAWRGADYDAILMDVQMPKLDGVAAARAIRREEAAAGRRRTPILALTANAMRDQVQFYLDEGMDGVVAKPIEVRSLFAALDEVVSAPQAPAEETGARQAAR